MRRMWIAGVAIAVILILGAVMWMTQEERTQRAMMNYLEDKYGEKFEMEFFDKGDMFFPDLYGDDKMMVHPVGKPEIPFYVFKDSEESSGFYDLYVPAYFSYQYTEKYKHEILDMSERTMAVKFVLSSADWPVEAEWLERSVENVVESQKDAMNINLKLAIYLEDEVDINAEPNFLYELYAYMKEQRNDGKSIHLAVAYIRENKFDEAEKLIRIYHADNVSWGMLGEAVVYEAYFGRQEIQDASFFEQFFAK